MELYGSSEVDLLVKQTSFIASVNEDLGSETVFSVQGPTRLFGVLDSVSICVCICVLFDVYLSIWNITNSDLDGAFGANFINFLRDQNLCFICEWGQRTDVCYEQKPERASKSTLWCGWIANFISMIIWWPIFMSCRSSLDLCLIYCGNGVQYLNDLEDVHRGEIVGYDGYFFSSTVANKRFKKACTE